MRWASPSADPLADLRALATRLDSERRVVICDPADVDRLREAFARWPTAGLWEVRETAPHGPGPGNIWVLKASVT